MKANFDGTPHNTRHTHLSTIHCTMKTESNVQLRIEAIATFVAQVEGKHLFASADILAAVWCTNVGTERERNTLVSD